MKERDEYVQNAPNFDGVLPAAGAYTSQGYQTLSPTCRRITVAVKYAKDAGATTGQVQFKIDWQINGEGGYFETVIDATTTSIAPPEETMPEYELVVKGPATTSIVMFRQVSLEAPNCVTGVRILASECGDTAHPGVCTIKLFSSDVL
jgi:hypothetical protein